MTTFRILIVLLIVLSWVFAFMADVKNLAKEDRDNWGVFAATVTVFGFGLLFCTLLTWDFGR